MMHLIPALTHLVAAHAALAYTLIFLGVLIEGEFTLILAGVLSHLGILGVVSALGVGFLGACAKTVSWYYGGILIKKKWPESTIFHYLHKRISYFLPHFRERPFWSIFISKFIYGINHVALIFAGYAKINFPTYFKAEFFSSLIWTPALFALGSFFSYAAFNISRDFRKFTLIILGFLFAFLLFERLFSFIFEFIEKHGDEHIL